MLFAGGVTMLVQGYAPIFAQAKGFEPAQIGLMLLLMQLGIFVVPLSAGFVSDRVDRRWVIVACTVLIVGCAGFASEVAGLNFFLVAAFGLWAGSTKAIFSVTSAGERPCAARRISRPVCNADTGVVEWGGAGARCDQCAHPAVRGLGLYDRGWGAGGGVWFHAGAVAAAGTADPAVDSVADPGRPCDRRCVSSAVGLRVGDL